MTTTAARRYLGLLADPWYRCLVDLQDLISYETARFWRARSVRCLHLPITTSSVSSPMGLGSDSLPVRVDLFGVPTYLADSMQFMLEYGCRLVPEGCYYLMPSFRGEQADETHLNQFFHSEVEITGGLDDVIDVGTEYVRHLATACLDQLAPQLTAVAGGVTHIEDFLARMPSRVTVADATELLGPNTDYLTEAGAITRRGEHKLIELLGPAVWLTHFDHASVPFYQAYDTCGQRARNADLLLGPGELIGCGERHVTGDQVRAALRAHQVAEEDYQWYVDMKTEYPMLTSGFGMGVERMAMWVLSCPDIRRTQLLERYNGVPAVP
jgi:asparaginyl-tRNA synthetase